jgi:hypothetical protein
LQAPDSGDLARIALPLAAKRGDAALFDGVRAVLARPPTPETRVVALSALAAFEDPALVGRTLDLVLDGTVRAQDLRYVFPWMGLRPASRDAVHIWIAKHFDELAARYPSHIMGRVVRTIPALCDAARVRAAGEFLRPRVAKLEGVERDLRQSLEEGQRCAALAAWGRVDVTRRLAGR